MHRFVNFVLILVALLAIFPIYTRYKVAAARCRPAFTWAGWT